MCSLFAMMSQKYCRLWMVWNADVYKAIALTSPYNNNPDFDDVDLKLNWIALIDRSRNVWESIVQARTINGVELEEAEAVEQGLSGDVDEDMELEDMVEN